MRRVLSLLSLLLVSACYGPWDMEPGTSTVTLPRLTVSNLVVAGRGYDTIWLSRSLSLTGTYDSTRTFVDTTHSYLRIIRLDGGGAPDTIAYHLAPPSAVAWVPEKPADTARHGAHYRLEARIVWDSSTAWGNGSTQKEWKTSTLSATTYTPSVFAQGRTFQAPLEALFPQLAGSGIAAFLSDTANAGLKDSLLRQNVTSATLDSLRQGLPVFRSIKSGDTIWYIRSADAVTGLDGASSVRQDRAFLIPQTLDRSVFGGILSLQRFDTTRARILDPITATLYKSLGKSTIDSADYYQKGGWRMTGFTEAYQSVLLYWPSTLQLANLEIGYTGRNVFYAYSMDTLYALHLNGLSSSNTALPYTNIAGGTGYFSGAAADSVSLYVMSPTADTFAVSDLRAAWCRDKRKKSAKNGTSVPPECAGN